MIYPAIDLMNGKAVQLIQGKTKKIELDQPLEIAKQFKITGEIHIIDLDAAMEKGNNRKLIQEILKIVPARVGGGIRTVKDAQELLNYGATKIIVGTKANKEFLEKLCKTVPKEKIIIAIDARNGKIVNQGWTNSIDKTPLEAVLEFEQ